MLFGVHEKGGHGVVQLTPSTVTDRPPGFDVIVCAVAPPIVIVMGIVCVSGCVVDGLVATTVIAGLYVPGGAPE